MEEFYLKDITAILLHYDDPKAIQKTLASLNTIHTRISSILIFTETTIEHSIVAHHSNQVRLLPTEGDLGQALNRSIKNIHTSYILFLQHTDYLSPHIQQERIQLPSHKTVLGTYNQHQHLLVIYPFLVRTSYIKKHVFMSSRDLPFYEALLPVWMSQIDRASTFLKPDLIKPFRQKNHTNAMERQRFIEKYQMSKKYMDSPTLSIVLSNYNMEKYVATAIRSCLLQTEQPNQICIMDDGSTDQSKQQIERFHDGRQIYVYSKSNEGKARALNDLLQCVSSDFIVELDADDFLDPNAIEVMKEQLSTLTEDTAVLYGNMRRWKQMEGDLLIKRIEKGRPIHSRADLMAYRFPLGPRIYKTSCLRKEGGFPVISFKDGRLYEDVSVLNRLIKKYQFKYYDFTVYNVREHEKSITKKWKGNWKDFIKYLD